MKKILILLAALAAMLTFAASCSDDDEPNDDIIACNPGPQEPDWNEFTLAGTVVHDSTLNFNVIIVDTIATPTQVVNFLHRIVESDIILEPLRNKYVYDKEESFDNYALGQEITFKIECLYGKRTDIRHAYVVIKDVETLPKE